jgi:hypothetical protein
VKTRDNPGGPVLLMIFVIFEPFAIPAEKR